MPRVGECQVTVGTRGLAAPHSLIVGVCDPENDLCSQLEIDLIPLRHLDAEYGWEGFALGVARATVDALARTYGGILAHVEGEE